MSHTGMTNVQFDGSTRANKAQRSSSGRLPLTNTNGNSPFAGYGMSAGLKMSNLGTTSAQGFTKPSVRPRRNIYFAKC